MPKEWLRSALPSLVWCVLVLVGLMFIEFGGAGRSEAPRATHSLPFDTWLLNGDLRWPGFSGRYIVTPGGVAKDMPVGPSDLADQPVVPGAPPVRLLFSLPVSYADVVKGVNAGTTAQLCGKAPLALGTVTVTFVRCAADGTTDCSAVVEVPASAAADLVGKGVKDGTWISELHLAPTCK